MTLFPLQPPAHTPLRGEEPFSGIDATVLDFWRFAMSNLHSLLEARECDARHGTLRRRLNVGGRLHLDPGAVWRENVVCVPLDSFTGSTDGTISAAAMQN